MPLSLYLVVVAAAVVDCPSAVPLAFLSSTERCLRHGDKNENKGEGGGRERNGGERDYVEPKEE